MNKKICLLTDSLSSGGAERMVSNLSFSLTKFNYGVSIVSMLDNIIYSYSGSLYNFGKIKKDNVRIISLIKFRAYFKENNFEIIIDHRVRNKFFKELVFSKFVFNNSKVIYCVHHFDLSLYFPSVKAPCLSKLTLAKNRKIVAVSNEIQNALWRKMKLHSSVLYNYVILEKDRPVENSKIFTFSNYIIGVGRLTKIKQFDVLITCYKESDLSKNGIKLLILGDGIEKKILNRLITDLDLKDNVKIHGFNSNAFSYIKSAKALVLSSKNEGFPMVLIEALALKTPVISFNCKSGPSEIVIHEENGLLVKDQDKEDLIRGLNRLLDNGFYCNLKGNLNQKTNSFSEELILKEWVDLIEGFK